MTKISLIYERGGEIVHRQQLSDATAIPLRGDSVRLDDKSFSVNWRTFIPKDDDEMNVVLTLN